jgi:hypothetical protein
MLRKLMPLLVVIVTTGLTVAAIELLPQTLFYPVVDLFAATGVQSTFVQPGQTTVEGCERILSETTRSVRAGCSTCKMVERCLHGLPPALRDALSHGSIPQPSARAANDPLTVVFSAADPSLAMSVCQQAEAKTASNPTAARLVCFASGTPR